jgi:peptidylamidoglycolate lyase
MIRSLLCLFFSLQLGVACLCADDDVLGQGAFRYRVVKDWAAPALGKVSVKNGHSVAIDKAGRIIFLTDDPKNNIIVLNAAGELLESWTARMPGAHGLTLVKEDGKEVLFITDTALHEVRKLTLKGEELAHYEWPQATGLYTSAKEYKPSKLLHTGDSGEFYVFDGYGKDFIHHYRADGALIRTWGGTLGEGENQLLHFGPHGGGIDRRATGNPVILVCMSDRQEVKRFSLGGQFIDKFALPGGNPRDAVFFGEFLFIPHLGDQWPKDKNAPGFLSVLDKSNHVISNIGGTQPEYDHAGQLQIMHAVGHAFIHPHGMAVDGAGNVYVAQFSSPAVPLLKLERLK